MKTLTVLQPWATLIALGEKRIETRSWQTSYRGPLAIHAGKNPQFIQGYENMTAFEPFRSVLDARGYNFLHNAQWPNPAGVWGYYPPEPQWDSFPLGAIVATCELVTCVHLEHDCFTRFSAYDAAGSSYTWELTTQEKSFGDYTPGRYAWLLDNIQILPAPIRVKGAQGLWEWQP